MYKVEIKKEHLPIRCEICHQRDFFDPIKNQCLRCLNCINVDHNLHTSKKKFIQQNILKRIFWITDLPTAIFLGSLIGILVLVIAGYIFNPIFKFLPEVFVGLGFVLGLSITTIMFLTPSFIERVIVFLIYLVLLGIGGLFGVIVIALFSIFSIIVYRFSKK